MEGTDLLPAKKLIHEFGEVPSGPKGLPAGLNALPFFFSRMGPHVMRKKLLSLFWARRLLKSWAGQETP
jgi:hypothetical protein